MRTVTIIALLIVIQSVTAIAQEQQPLTASEFRAMLATNTSPAFYDSPLAGIEDVAIAGHYAGSGTEYANGVVILVFIPRGNGVGIHVPVYVTGESTAKIDGLKVGAIVTVSGSFAFVNDPDFGNVMVIRARAVNILRSIVQ